jgi:uncharacterized protein YfiM (DUF2279 family)
LSQLFCRQTFRSHLQAISEINKRFFRSFADSYFCNRGKNSQLKLGIFRKITIAAILLTSMHRGYAQIVSDTTPKKSKGRVWLVAGTHAAFLVGSYIALDNAWYKDFPKEKFHFFNDFLEWNQMDKAGHIWTSYQLSRASAASWKWAGLGESASVAAGSLSALAYQSIIEINDGYSAEWGFSWPDMGANIVGASAFAFQQLGWNDQRIQIKMSYHPSDYPSDELERRRQLFGDGSLERILKDYNSQTYWASVNLKSFFKKSNLPAWLNLSFGYGAEGILGGFENKWTDKDGNEVTRYDVQRLRQFYFAPDIDLTKIRTRSKFLRSVFFVVNAIKIPAPTISWDSKGTCRVYALYF